MNDYLQPLKQYPQTNESSHQFAVRLNPVGMDEQPKRVRQRTLRACDACRKMKIKCMMNSDEPPCEACKLNSRACKFEHIGVKREKPPSLRDVDQLNRRVAQLEAVLIKLRPQIDLSSLPRTSDQAKIMANALQATPANDDPRLNAQTHFGPQSSIKEAEDGHDHEYEEIEHDSEDDEEEDEDEDEEFQSMLKSMGECQLGSCQLMDQVKDSSSGHDNKKSHTLEANFTGLGAEDQHSALIMEYCDNYFRKDIDEYWPVEDLATKLISTYFKFVQPYLPVVHEFEFKHDYQAGLSRRDVEFRSLCYAIFAAASPYSDDPRVLYTPHSENSLHPRQSAGALFAHASLGGHKYPLLDLHGLQSLAVLSSYMLEMSNPLHTCTLVNEFIRRAVAAGAHLEHSTRWNSSFINNQLRKRAFYTLVGVEKHTTSSLGYLNLPQSDLDLASPPLSVDDVTLDLIDKQDKMQPTPEAREKFREGLYSSTQTPAEAAFNSMWSLKQKLQSTRRHMILNQLDLSAQALSSTTSGDDGSSSKTNKNRQLLVLNIGTIISDYMENGMDPMGRWNPSLTSKRDLFATSYCACLLWSSQIRVHLEAVSVYHELAHLCYQSASSILDVMEDLKALGHLQLLRAATPFFLAPVGLFLLWAISQENNPLITADCKANAWIKITRCVDILNILAPVSFLSEKLALKFTAYMDHLREEIHNPTMDTSTSTHTSKKRPFSEIMAKKVEKPTISNLLFSQHPSPTNPNTDAEAGQASVNLKFEDSMKPTESAQFPTWNLGSHPPMVATDQKPTNNQQNHYDPASYSHLQLQNLLLQSGNVPKQPSLDLNHPSIPLPTRKLPPSRPQQLNSEGSFNPSLLGITDFAPILSTFSSSTPVIPQVAAHLQGTTSGQQAYIPMSERLTAVSSSSTVNYVKSGENSVNRHSFDPNFCTVDNLGNNKSNSSSFNSNFIPNNFLNYSNTIPPNSIQPIIPPNQSSHDLQSSRPPRDINTYNPTFFNQNQILNSYVNQTTTTHYNQPNNRTFPPTPLPHPGFSQTQPVNYHPSIGSSISNHYTTRTNTAFPNPQSFNPPSINSNSFSNRDFQNRPNLNQKVSINPNQANHSIPTTDTFNSSNGRNNSLENGSSAYRGSFDHSNPSNNPQLSARSNDMYNGNRVDADQMFSICDTWLF
ncbi:hypothetical protein Pst134EA_011946 [Puccinia striiformis f. sp. tritici]|uniref:Zn(2)-C6 fungal-type domain-containing protein n=1 Tax=Puccinia striiformis f. sp. tritici PST-78 TaxID=1165861 RepID=A0A0L0VLD6_9BASI|nr:hypothetical protein Pst134EA_011946 [Puccinia striiformis f. sp. tritici]KAH9468321.1 hypothetical protein Pst134EA_011946 [Puccinia striiformis f. sp. tritici]KNF00084.1 hypothetical protein PSTG_06705 [Puccinia striiformis f. sp. tritici PST-78]